MAEPTPLSEKAQDLALALEDLGFEKDNAERFVREVVEESMVMATRHLLATLVAAKLLTDQQVRAMLGVSDD